MAERHLRTDELNFPSRATGKSIERNTPVIPSRRVTLGGNTRRNRSISQTSAAASTWYVTGAQTRQCVYITTVIGEWVAGAVKETAAATGVAERRDGGGRRGWRRQWPWTWLPSLFAHSRCVARPKQPTGVDTSDLVRLPDDDGDDDVAPSWGISLHRHIYSSN